MITNRPGMNTPLGMNLSWIWPAHSATVTYRSHC